MDPSITPPTSDYAIAQGPRLEKRRNIFSRFGLSCFVILAVTVLLQLGGRVLVQAIHPEWRSEAWYLLGLTFGPMYLIGVPLGILLLTRVPKADFLPRKMRLRDLLIFLLMCFPLLYVGNLIGTVLSTLLHTLVGTTPSNPLDAYLSGSRFWITAVVAVVIAPVIEETIFRKLLIDRIRPYGEGISVLVSAVTFGLFHGNFNQFFYAFGLGALFAFVYVKTGRVRYTVMLHMAINFVGGFLGPLLVRGLDVTQLSKLRGDGAEEALRYLSGHVLQVLALSLYSLSLMTLAIIGLVLLITRRRAFSFEPGQLQLNRGQLLKTAFINWGMALLFLGTVAMFVMSLF